MIEKICGNCKYCKEYSGTFGQYCRCENSATAAFAVGRSNAGCSKFERKSSKAKPRRICDFCERGKRREGENGYRLRLVQLTPLQAINLTTGENEEKARKPFYAMFLSDRTKTSEAEMFQVKFCPFCGRKLVGE